MYEERVKRLRELADEQMFDFDRLPYLQAADAIEELNKYVNTIMRLKSEGWYLQQTKNHDGYAAITTMPIPDTPKGD